MHKFFLSFRVLASPFISEANRSFLKMLISTVKGEGFKAVSSALYVPLSLLKAFAKSDDLLQFVVMTSCEGGFELLDGAFGLPKPSSNVDKSFFTYPDPLRKQVVLRYSGDRWDLIIPVEGKESLFW